MFPLDLNEAVAKSRAEIVIADSIVPVGLKVMIASDWLSASSVA